MQFKSLKIRILLWFGSLAFVVLSLFAFSFNYFLNQSIDNNIKSKLQLLAHKRDKKIPNVEVLTLHNGTIEDSTALFSLKNYKKYLNQKENFFIITHTGDDDYIDALYIDEQGVKTTLILRKNIDNRIENFQDVLLFLIPILLLAFIFLASKMIDKILLPINKLINATKDISITKFTQEIELPKDEDEIKELVLSFNAMIKRLQNGVERLDRFNTDVSHELKTPLTVIQGEIEIALRKLRTPQKYEQSLKTIQKQSKQIELIVKQLLLLTKYSKENIKESFEKCSVDTLLMQVIDKFQLQFQEKNLKLHIEKIEPINMQANPILIESIFVNLIDNAIKYTSKNRNIYISLYQDSKIYFSIKDEGIGISKEHLSKITERFYRADSSRNKKIEGFGLGLSIVKNSVLMHDGNLEIESDKENGTTVKVVF
ncbi:sensor histidine kinase [Sulfurimonas autotrophica]|uniref:histidine kinase n=1 Tax=Sulfurimonas autotrophica (strain ATCC BAA-671 / DSM 16294 / JCM 11897 / OK10) TaxID=563040 RepID=E0UPJ5_SULAO|nr:ATP-binding protein [Sulfurimonas autotrophica]ADN09725.1 integral membrane sensor signal transduction histidine kinase [Sulfurimonas autotrophica DSM 16294]